MSYINQYPQNFTLIESNQLIIYLTARTLPPRLFVSPLPLVLTGFTGIAAQGIAPLSIPLCEGDGQAADFLRTYESLIWRERSLLVDTCV